MQNTTKVKMRYYTADCCAHIGKKAYNSTRCSQNSIAQNELRLCNTRMLLDTNSNRKTWPAFAWLIQQLLVNHHKQMTQNTIFWLAFIATTSTIHTVFHS